MLYGINERKGFIAITGGIGTGKTTLFRLITGQESPDSGSIKIGSTVELGYVDQLRDTLDPEKNVWEEISEGSELIKLGKREIKSRAYLARFNFTGSDYV